MYVCGITPYDYAHIGHGRCYLVYDVLYRFLKYKNLDVVYCRNVTDIDDKLIKKAEEKYKDPSKYLDIANLYFQCFQDDLLKLNCLVPDYQPRVTAFIPEIINMITVLIEKKHAYVLDDGVYFDTESFNDYCALSKRKEDSLIAGSRVKIEQNKKNPYDFALWKKTEIEPYFESPFGKGRPGWHIECSAMSNSIFGSSISIHGGGMDLIFPHHENELAQNKCFNNHSNIDIWMHCAFINKDNQKMSKSLDNFVYLKEYLEKYDPMIFRYAMIIHHYTHPINFSDELFIHAEKEYTKLCVLFEDNHNDNNQDELNVFEAILDCLYNDLNIQKIIGLIFSNQSVIKQHTILRLKIKDLIIKVLGLSLKYNENEIIHDEKIKQLILDREEARKKKDFKTADDIRNQLKELGYNIQDK